MSQTANLAGRIMPTNATILATSPGTNCGVWAFCHPIQGSVSQCIISIGVVITIGILKICADMDNLLFDMDNFLRNCQPCNRKLQLQTNVHCKHKLQMSQAANTTVRKIRKQFELSLLGPTLRPAFTMPTYAAILATSPYTNCGICAFCHPIKRSLSQLIISIGVVIAIVVLNICAQR